MDCESEPVRIPYSANPPETKTPDLVAADSAKLKPAAPVGNKPSPDAPVYEWPIHQIKKKSFTSSTFNLQEKMMNHAPGSKTEDREGLSLTITSPKGAREMPVVPNPSALSFFVQVQDATGAPRTHERWNSYIGYNNWPFEGATPSNCKVTIPKGRYVAFIDTNTNEISSIEQMKGNGDNYPTAPSKKSCLSSEAR